MAMAKLTALVLLLALVATFSLAVSAVSEQYQVDAKQSRFYGQGSLKPSQCAPQCNRRCGNTQYRNACLLFCNKCCNKCLCVPPGYYGNKQVCPCYNNWKTKEGGPKCP